MEALLDATSLACLARLGQFRCAAGKCALPTPQGPEQPKPDPTIHELQDPPSASLWGGWRNVSRIRHPMEASNLGFENIQRFLPNPSPAARLHVFCHQNVEL